MAATPQSIEGVFSTFLGRYAKRHPGVQIKLIEAVGGPLVSLLEHGQVHVTVGVIQSSQSDNPFIESFPLSPLEFLATSQTPLEGATGGDVDIGSSSRVSALAPRG